MVRFVECETPATDEQVDEIERRAGLRFPSGLRRLFREANGGRPEPYVYRDENNDTDISECLALREGRGSAWWTYELMVLSQKLVPRHFFPFAVDSGGDTFLVDCSSAQGMVFRYRHDTAFEPVVPLNVAIEELWSRLV